MPDSENDVLSRMMFNNREWAAKVHQDNPGFFRRLARKRSPRVLWIGCSDSRVPGNESIGEMPGEVFFHRNIANQMLYVDFNSLAVLQYAVDALRVSHIVICGHYGCGGVKTALKQHEFGLVSNWLH
jgi:carbonic anhydrase